MFKGSEILNKFKLLLKVIAVMRGGQKKDTTKITGWNPKIFGDAIALGCCE